MLEEDCERSRGLIKEATPVPVAPPDGGYGWVIVGAAFVSILIVDGTVFCFGIFFLEFLEHFGESKETTAWLGSVMGATSLVTGPLVAALCNRFGCRLVAIAGSLLAAAAQIMCTFSTNFPGLLSTYGLLTGTGLGMMYLPAVVMVGFYFDKRRALATGIAGCGAGIGAFSMAPLAEKLIEVYSWKGAIWLMAGLCLNGAVCGSLYRPLKPQKPKASKCDLALYESDQYSKGVAHSMKNLSVTPKPYQKFSDSLVVVSRSCSNIHSDDPVGAKFSSDTQLLKDVQVRYAVDLERPMFRKDTFYSGSISLLKKLDDSTSKAPNDTRRHERSETKPKFICHKAWTGCQSMSETLREMMDFSLLWNPVFCIYGASCFLCMAGFYVPFFYLPDMAISFGMTREQAAFLISITGIANTLTRVGCGWVSDQPWANCLIINNCALVVGGVATIVAPFCHTYPLLATYSFVFGSCIAVFVSLRSILMVEFMGLERLTTSFGLVTMCQGLSGYIGAPIAGALFDASGYYNLSFYVAGGTLAMAGIICFPLRKVSTWYNRRELHRKQSTCATDDKQSTEENGCMVIVE